MIMVRGLGAPQYPNILTTLGCLPTSLKVLISSIKSTSPSEPTVSTKIKNKGLKLKILLVTKQGYK